MMVLAVFVGGGAVGALITWLFFRSRITSIQEVAQARVESANALSVNKLAAAEEQITELKAELQTRETLLTENFRALSNEALQSQNEAFLQLGKGALGNLVQPLNESLARVDAKIAELKSISATQERLETETSYLARALHTTPVPGNWGEMQLGRVVELSGMLEHCDFDTNEGVTLLVRLPNGRTVAVDGTVPMNEYLASLEATNEETRLQCLKRHSETLRAHIEILSSRMQGHELVVCFVPSESVFSHAVREMPDIVDIGADNRVLVAGPTTLIALLKSAAFGWRHDRISRNAEEIRLLGRELQSQLGDFAMHFRGVKAGLDRAVSAYNKSVGTFETGVQETSRKLQAATPGSLPVASLEPADRVTRGETPTVGAEELKTILEEEEETKDNVIEFRRPA